ncbi:Putative RNA-binding protein [Rhizopus microsporus]|nr:Putative RNA-binding protein [Rhizopus microsporus]
MVYPYISSGITIVSFFDLKDAKRAKTEMQSTHSDYKLFYIKPCFIGESMNETIFITMRSTISDRLDDFNAMEFLSYFGSVHAISEMKLNPYCRIVALEYHDQRSILKLYNRINMNEYDKITFHVYESIAKEFICDCCWFGISPSVKPNSSVVTWSNIVAKTSCEDTKGQPKVTQKLPKSSSEFSLFSVASTSTDNSNLAHSKHTTESLEAETSLLSISKCEEYGEHEVSSRESLSKPCGKEIDIEKIRSGQDKRTTFMIRNIPNKYTQKMLKDMLDETHKNTYDFLYLRMDFRNHCNVGYAFINFIDPKSVITLAEQKMGKKWTMFNSEKRLSISYAAVQGKEALIQKFRNSHVMAEEEAYQPKIFYSSGSLQGQEQPFPKPNTAYQKRQYRYQSGSSGSTKKSR